MDALASLLEGPRARGAFFMKSILEPPWSLRIQDEAPLTLIANMRGAAWVVPDSGAPIEIRSGDIVIVRGPKPYTVADRPDTPPDIIIAPGQVTMTPDGEVLCETMSLGVRKWGNNPAGPNMMVTGTYESCGAVSQRLLRALPAFVVMPETELDTPLVALLGREVERDEPGQGVVLDRLLDLVLIAALRAWFARDEAPSWYQAYGDPVVGKALRLLQNNPAHAWTVASLATECGLSRAGLARRFTDLVGESPMAFLTEWRLALAADLLVESDATVDAVARQVGYGSAFALSTAFKRERGVSPREFRLGA